MTLRVFERCRARELKIYRGKKKGAPAEAKRRAKGKCRFDMHVSFFDHLHIRRGRKCVAAH